PCIFLHKRKELCKLREKLEQHKNGLMETIANRKKFLSSLPSHLKSLKKASLPVQQQLGIMHTKKLKQQTAAELLPPPLYIVYSQLLAQKEAFGERIELEVVGSIKDAQTFAQQQANKDIGTMNNTETSRLEDDAPDDDEDGQRRRKRPKKSVVKENADRSGTYQLHPLKVILFIYDDEDTEAKPSKLITLRFEYLVKLNVICVAIEDTEEGPDNNILCNLFPGDTGMELPHQVYIFGISYGHRDSMFSGKELYHLKVKLTTCIFALSMCGQGSCAVRMYQTFLPNFVHIKQLGGPGRGQNVLLSIIYATQELEESDFTGRRLGAGA
ncbi:THO complex subunit 5B-like, partial [Asparagus officinalis]|uniref:THO complex subunit 5B-like n=1 Tax=Asparagus officinalis TaxID=4686 RepID=UPI00098E1A74